jgi:hypothetical protein
MIIYVMSLMLLYFLWCLLCDVSFTISYSYSLSKVFRWYSLVTTRKVEIPESCFVRDKTRRQAIGSIIRSLICLCRSSHEANPAIGDLSSLPGLVMLFLVMHGPALR